jgi:Nitrate reductase delta subunit
MRALGAVADRPADADAAGRALGLPALGNCEHTEAFVLNCPPYASVYLGPDGAIGGEGADRVAGFWRAMGLSPPTEPDHLTAILSLYAALDEAAADSRRASTAAALAWSGAVLLYEHIWPWLPLYLDAVSELETPALTTWVTLTRTAIAAEVSAHPAGGLPLALRAAPGEPDAGDRLADLVSALVTPVRSGIVLTRRRLADGADQAGVGYRIGERRFALRAMFEQDPGATLTWLSRECRRWERRHASRAAADDAVTRWWAGRAAQTGRLLAEFAGRPSSARPAR